jgi:hypothetical protein
MEAAMLGVDRVAVIAWVWFIFWTAVGDAIGHWMNMPGTGMVFGFLFAMCSIFLWPWVLPRFVDDWMHDPTA